jgi:predicted nucleotidyltransferase component of viral defense system
MSKASPSNLPASVRARLQNLAKQRDIPFDLILARFAVERLLYRLSQSKHAHQFLLKGAMLFAIWTPDAHRPTRDVDLLGFGSTELDTVKSIFAEICAITVEDDALEYRTETLEVMPIREAAHYGGVRVNLRAMLGNIRIPVQIDIGYGDVVTPEPDFVTFPGLLEFTAPKLRAYPIYTVVAEKLEALVTLGETNTRMKDFYDLWFLSQRFDFDGILLRKAIQATFERRGSQLKPLHEIVGLSASFIEMKDATWKGFLRRNRMDHIELAEVITRLRAFLSPILAGPQSERPE